MVSEPNGQLRILVWVDDDEVKALVDNNGRLPVTVGEITVTQDVNIKSSDIDVPVTIDAATINVPIDIQAASITVPTQEQNPLTSIQSQAYGWDTSNWHKLAMLWGYTDRYHEALDTTATGAFETLPGTVVAAGYVFVLQAAYLVNNTTGPTTQTIRVIKSGGGTIFLQYASAVAQNIPTMWQGEIVLAPGDKVNMTMNGCVAGDTIHAGYWGYRMKVNE